MWNDLKSSIDSLNKDERITNNILDSKSKPVLESNNVVNKFDFDQDYWFRAWLTLILVVFWPIIIPLLLLLGITSPIVLQGFIWFIISIIVMLKIGSVVNKFNRFGFKFDQNYSFRAWLMLMLATFPMPIVFLLVMIEIITESQFYEYLLSNRSFYFYERFLSNMGMEISESLPLDTEQSLIQSLFIEEDSDVNQMIESIRSELISKNHKIQIHKE